MQPSKEPGVIQPRPALLQHNQEIQSIYGNKEFRIYQDAIEKIQNNEDQLPSLPTITLEIRNATSNPNVSVNQLTNLISQDPSLTVIIMKHASSALYRSAEKPKNLNEAINRLGMSAVENIVLSHSIKSLFVLRDHHLKSLYKQAWRRQTLKACMSLYLAKTIHYPRPEDALVASLLSEVGTLSLLVALQGLNVPAEATYRILCKHYSKHLGAILLAKWGVSPIFIDVLRKTGQWSAPTSASIGLADVVNLALFHTIHRLNPRNDLPSIQELAAFKKLSPQHTHLNSSKCLHIVDDHMDEIEQLAKSFA